MGGGESVWGRGIYKKRVNGLKEDKKRKRNVRKLEFIKNCSFS